MLTYDSIRRGPSVNALIATQFPVWNSEKFDWGVGNGDPYAVLQWNFYFYDYTMK